MSDDLTPRFFQWMEAHNISRTEAARLMGVDEASLSTYRSRGLPKKKQARALQLMKEMVGEGDNPDTNRIFVNFTDDQLKTVNEAASYVECETKEFIVKAATDQARKDLEKKKREEEDERRAKLSIVAEEEIDLSNYGKKGNSGK
jgi:uncharacterized protein (DUF1778 family)